MILSASNENQGKGNLGQKEFQTIPKSTLAPQWVFKTIFGAVLSQKESIEICNGDKMLLQNLGYWHDIMSPR